MLYRLVLSTRCCGGRCLDGFAIRGLLKLILHYITKRVTRDDIIIIIIVIVIVVVIIGIGIVIVVVIAGNYFIFRSVILCVRMFAVMMDYTVAHVWPYAIKERWPACRAPSQHHGRGLFIRSQPPLNPTKWIRPRRLQRWSARVERLALVQPRAAEHTAERTTVATTPMYVQFVHVQLLLLSQWMYNLFRYNCCNYPNVCTICWCTTVATIPMYVQLVHVQLLQLSQCMHNLFMYNCCNYPNVCTICWCKTVATTLMYVQFVETIPMYVQLVDVQLLKLSQCMYNLFMYNCCNYPNVCTICWCTTVATIPMYVPFVDVKLLQLSQCMYNLFMYNCCNYPNVCTLCWCTTLQLPQCMYNLFMYNCCNYPNVCTLCWCTTLQLPQCMYNLFMYNCCNYPNVCTICWCTTVATIPMYVPFVHVQLLQLSQCSLCTICWCKLLQLSQYKYTLVLHRTVVSDFQFNICAWWIFYDHNTYSEFENHNDQISNTLKMNIGYYSGMSTHYTDECEFSELISKHPPKKSNDLILFAVIQLWTAFRTRSVALSHYKEHNSEIKSIKHCITPPRWHSGSSFYIASHILVVIQDVCCSDGLHCCARGSICDLRTLMCIPGKDGGSLTWYTPKPAVPSV